MSAKSNQDLFSRAKVVIPGGVNSPVRAFGAVGGVPRFIEKADGPYLWDVEGRRYIDYVGSWGAMILGHNDPDIFYAAQIAMRSGFSFGAPTENEVILAETISRLLPSMEQVRLVSSGTEATMSTIRLARGFTNKEKIIKFEGCYHGHSDSLLVKAGSGQITFSKNNQTLIQSCDSGILSRTADSTLVLNYNDIDQLDDTFAKHGNTIAAIIVEPIAGNMNLIRAKLEFLQAMRLLCDQYGSLLIFDEVMSGFRVSLGGMQTLVDIKPDLTCLGKVIGGGMPLAAFGGRFEVMAKLSPIGPVYQAGTLSGHPIAVAAGLATLEKIQMPDFYKNLSSQTKKLVDAIALTAKKSGVSCVTDAIGGMFGLYFANQVPNSYTEVMACNLEAFKKFFHAMLDAKIYLAPSAFEVGFVSSCHSDQVILETIQATAKVFSTTQFYENQ